jgi:hypothetical protein
MFGQSTNGIDLSRMPVVNTPQDIKDSVTDRVSQEIPVLEACKTRHLIHGTKDTLIQYRIAYAKARGMYDLCAQALNIRLPSVESMLEGHLAYINTPILEW